jgi:hypothetical protein
VHNKAGPKEGGKMAKRINISIPDEMFNKLSELKDELGIGKGRDDKRINRKISTICQEALGKIIEEAEVSRIYRMAGLEDGEIAAKKLTQRDKEFIFKVLSAQGPYKKWSRFERVSVVNDHFVTDPIYDVLVPKFTGLMDGKIILNNWVEADPLKAEDRRGEMSWSYIEGCFEGVVKAVYKEKRGKTGI